MTDSAASSLEISHEKLSVVEKLGFGAGDLASNLLFQTFNMFLLFFYTDVVGLSASSVFWIYAVGKLWDMLNDPLMGAVADRTHTRWGRYRPYILGLAIPYGISAYLLFTVPEMSDSAKIFYCGATYIFATMMYTGVNIPYCALMGVITPDVSQRTLVSQYRFFMAFAGAWLINTFTLPLVKIFGDSPDSPSYNKELGYDPVSGYPTAMLVFGTLAAALFAVTFFTTKERVTAISSEKSAFRDDFKDLIKNLPWFVLFISAVFNLGNVAARNGVMLHYLNYFVTGSEELLFKVNLGITTLDITRVELFMSLGAFATVLGVLPTKALTTHFEKRQLLIFFMLAQGVVFASIYFVPAEQYELILGLHILGSLLAGPPPVIVFSMYADVADFSEWKNNRRATGLIIATILFAIKMGLWLGSQIAVGLLAYYGYSKEVATSPEIVDGIRVIFTWIPGVLAMLSGLVLFKYSIDDAFLEKIAAGLRERKDSTTKI